MRSLLRKSNDGHLLQGKQLFQFVPFYFQKVYPSFENRNLLMPIIANKLQVLKAVIIFNMILVMDYLPQMKIAAKMFCHYKAMLKNISPLGCHWIKEVFWPNFNTDITPAITSSALPQVAFGASMRQSNFGSLFWGRKFKSIGARTAPWVRGQVFAGSNPSFFPAINTSVPNKSAPALLVAIL